MTRLRVAIAIVAVVATTVIFFLLLAEHEQILSPAGPDSPPLLPLGNPNATTLDTSQPVIDERIGELASEHPKLRCLLEADARSGRHEESEEQFRQWVDFAQKTLAQSDDAENRLVAALLGTVDAEPTTYAQLHDVMDSEPRNPLIAWNYVEYCSGLYAPCGLASALVEQRALRADPSNGALWAKIAAKRFERGNRAGALEAMQQAATASQFDSFWIDHILAFERALRVVPNPNRRNGLIDAIGFVTVLPSSEVEIVRTCKQEAPRNPQWMDACLAYGKRLERDGRTLLNQMFGLAIQRNVMESAGDPIALMRVQDVEIRYSEYLRQFADASMNAMLEFDESLAWRYVELIQAAGEVEAMRQIRVEVDRLLASPEYKPCGD